MTTVPIMPPVPTAPADDERRPVLRVSRPYSSRPVEAVVLVLHGGKEHSFEPTGVLQLSVLRMIPFVWAVHRAGRGRVAVARLRYAVRGWNPEQEPPSPVADARWALAELRQRFGEVPIGVIGHSMGGRTALRVAADAQVHSASSVWRRGSSRATRTATSPTPRCCWCTARRTG